MTRKYLRKQIMAVLTAAVLTLAPVTAFAQDETEAQTTLEVQTELKSEAPVPTADTPVEKEPQTQPVTEQQTQPVTEQQTQPTTEQQTQQATEQQTQQATESATETIPTENTTEAGTEGTTEPATETTPTESETSSPVDDATALVIDNIEEVTSDIPDSAKAEIEEETETESETEESKAISELYVDPNSYPPLNVTENTIMIYQYLVDTMGLNHAAACGVLANIQLESNFNPLAIGDGGTSYGFCQWHLGRLSNLMSFCRANGMDYHTAQGQLAYLKQELEMSYPGVLFYLRNVPDTAQGAYEAGYYWCMYFEIPSQTTARSMQRGNLAKNEYYPQSFIKEVQVAEETDETKFVIPMDVSDEVETPEELCGHSLIPYSIAANTEIK